MATTNILVYLFIWLLIYSCIATLIYYEIPSTSIGITMQGYRNLLVYKQDSTSWCEGRFRD